MYRYDSSLFNYHATIINQLFNYHFGRFTRNRHTPKALKTECFAESISLFFRNTLLFCKKDVRYFPQNDKPKIYDTAQEAFEEISKLWNFSEAISIKTTNEFIKVEDLKVMFDCGVEYA